MKIAVIGTGIAGNVAAYHLRRKHDITVFEANDYVGVHNVQLGSKVTSVDRVLGEHVDVQLQSGVRATDDGNHHLVELAALGVGSLHNVVVDGEGKLGCVSASARLWMFMSLSLSISLMSSMML